MSSIEGGLSTNCTLLKWLRRNEADAHMIGQKESGLFMACKIVLGKKPTRKLWVYFLLYNQYFSLLICTFIYYNFGNISYINEQLIYSLSFQVRFLYFQVILQAHLICSTWETYRKTKWLDSADVKKKIYSNLNTSHTFFSLVDLKELKVAAVRNCCKCYETFKQILMDYIIHMFHV